MINRKLNKITNQSGQNLAEYIMVLLLIMTALMIMGPHIIRAWNAQQKGIDDAVRDSLDDPIKRGGALLGNCVACNNVYDCDKPPCCGQGPCSPLEATLTTVCPSPKPGEKVCDPEPPECTETSLCCTTPVPTKTALCGQENEPNCPPRMLRAKYECGIIGEQEKCILNPACACEIGSWGSWNPKPPLGWSGCPSSPTTTTYDFRLRDCLDSPSGEPCQECICPLTADHIGEEYQDVFNCPSPTIAP